MFAAMSSQQNAWLSFSWKIVFSLDKPWFFHRNFIHPAKVSVRFHQNISIHAIGKKIQPFIPNKFRPGVFLNLKVYSFAEESLVSTPTTSAPIIHICSISCLNDIAIIMTLLSHLARRYCHHSRMVDMDQHHIAELLVLYFAVAMP